MDYRSTRLMSMYKALHPKDGTERLLVSRKEVKIGLTSIEYCVDVTIWQFEDYIK